MAVKNYQVHLSLNGYEVQNFNFQNLASAPAGATAGRVYHSTGSSVPMFYNGTTWRPMDAAALTDGSIANSALTTNPLARANHTGQQTSSTISDLSATVQGYHLNQFAVPTASIPMAGYTFTGLATPTAAGQAAEFSWVMSQVQSAAAGISSKDPVTVVATSNISLTGVGQVIDGITIAAGMRVLAIGQTTASQNGPYTVPASGAWTRPTDEGGTQGELDVGAMWLATQGTAYAGTQWRMSNATAPTIGTTSVTIVQFGAGNSYTAGNGLQLSGSSFSVLPVAGGGIVAAAGGLSVDTTVVMRKAPGLTLGDGSTTAFTYTHNLGTQDIDVVVRLVSTQEEVEVNWAATTVNTATITFNTAPAANTYRAVAFG